jgi:hypothetical protein
MRVSFHFSLYLVLFIIFFLVCLFYFLFSYFFLPAAFFERMQIASTKKGLRGGRPTWNQITPSRNAVREQQGDHISRNNRLLHIYPQHASQKVK